MAREGGNICWGSMQDSPRKLTPPDNPLETAFGTDTSDMDVMTKGVSRLRVCGWVRDLRGATAETQLSRLLRGRGLTLSAFQSCSRALVGLRMPGALSHGVKTRRRVPAAWILLPGPRVGIRGAGKRSPILIPQEKTYSSVAKRRSFRVCKQGRC